jgi:hypothetical protein
MTPALLIVAALVAGDLPPPAELAKPAPKVEEIPEEHKIAVLACNPPQGVCMVAIEELADYIRGRVALAKKLREMSASKGCAKLEVPKPKLKKDRDL